MKNLITAIATRKPVVVWNPFNANDTLTKEEFLSLIKISKYSTVVFEGAWVIAYQPGVIRFGYETLKLHLKKAIDDSLPVYAAILKDEIEQQSIIEYNYKNTK
jgi:hypothetical protein